MGKEDYKDSNLKNKYRGLIKDPVSDLPKITVASNEKRTRAELLDMLEELFENDDLSYNPTFLVRVKAMLHILIKSVDNSLDDGVASAVATNTAKTGISNSQASAITANTSKTGITTTQADEITANTAKTGISTSQASAITANTSKVSFPFTGDTAYKGGSNSTAAFTHIAKLNALTITVTIPQGPKGLSQPAITKSVTLTLS